MADTTPPLNLTLSWKGVFPMGHVEYAQRADVYMAAAQRMLQHFDDIDLDRRGFFFLMSALPDAGDEIELDDLLFIGAAYPSFIRERMTDDRLQRAYREVMTEARDLDVYFGYGYLTTLPGGVDPKALHFDVENALVFLNEPLCNPPHMLDRYESRLKRELLIECTGDFFPLWRKLQALPVMTEDTDVEALIERE